MRVTTVIASAALAMAAVAAGALATETAGEVRALLGSALASGPAGERVLAAGSEIEAGELLATSVGGQAQIQFTEGTRIALGSDSSMKIDAYEIDSDGSGAKLEIEALEGIFRFISDTSDDKSYSIATPSATIALSGTAFDFTVTKSGGTRLLLLDGEVTMCGTEANGTCQTVATPCAMLRTDDGRQVEQVGSVAGTRTGDESGGMSANTTGAEVGLEQEIRENFPYQQSQSDLLEDFRVAGRPCLEGGVAPTPLAEPGLHIPPEVAIPVAAAAVICILLCRSGGGGGPTVPNHTN